jgi:DNA-directed RNA polymerase subunit RPC12/RpoP
MRINGSKSRNGNPVRCPRCGYRWLTKQRGYICCSRCKRYFEGINGK